MGEAKVVVVTEVSRISRNLIDGMTTVADWLAKDIRLVATTQSFDFSGPMGQMIASLLFNFASIETEQRRLRQARGIEQARKENKYKGRVLASFTADRDRMVDQRFAGRTIDEIAKLEGINRTTVIRHLNKASQAQIFYAITLAYENLGWPIDMVSVVPDKKISSSKYKIEDERVDVDARFEGRFYPQEVAEVIENASRKFLKKSYSRDEWEMYLSRFCTEYLERWWNRESDIDTKEIFEKSLIEIRKLNEK